MYLKHWKTFGTRLTTELNYLATSLFLPINLASSQRINAMLIFVLSNTCIYSVKNSKKYISYSVKNCKKYISKVLINFQKSFLRMFFFQKKSGFNKFVIAINLV